MRWLRRLLTRPAPRAVSYRQLIATLPTPTAEQTESFAEYVVGAHSWYKHLPCDPPGAPFVVFLDPNAGRAIVHTADGRAEYRDRVDGQERFHYTSMPTAEYLAKFGHWHYATDHGTQFVVRLPGTDHAQALGHGLARVMAEDGASIDVPPEVLTAGTVHLTAHVHENFVAGYLYMSACRLRKFREEQGSGLTDPSYGQDIIDLFDHHKDDFPGFDRQTEAERARQRAELRLALHRVRSLLAPGE